MKNYKKVLLLLLLSSIYWISCSSVKIPSSKEKEIKNLLKKYSFSGTVLVAEGDNFFYSEAFGYSDKEGNNKNNVTTQL